jgi:hypothetical protein
MVICCTAYVAEWHIAALRSDAAFGRFRSEADISRQSKPTGPVENDPDGHIFQRLSERRGRLGFLRTFSAK